jgi:hypothetical protein
MADVNIPFGAEAAEQAALDRLNKLSVEGNKVSWDRHPRLKDSFSSGGGPLDEKRAEEIVRLYNTVVNKTLFTKIESSQKGKFRVVVNKEAIINLPKSPAETFQAPRVDLSALQQTGGEKTTIKFEANVALQKLAKFLQDEDFKSSAAMLEELRELKNRIPVLEDEYKKVIDAMTQLDETLKIQSKVSTVLQKLEQQKSLQQSVDMYKELIELKNLIVSQNRKTIREDLFQKITNALLQKVTTELLQLDKTLSSQINAAVQDLEKFLQDEGKEKNLQNYAGMHKELSTAKNFIVSQNKTEILKDEYQKVTNALRSLHKNFSEKYPNQRLFICENNQSFTIAESLFIQQSVVEQTRVHSGLREDIPGFLEAPQSLVQFLSQPQAFEINSENLQELLECSQEFDMPILKDKCHSYLLSLNVQLEIDAPQSIKDFLRNPKRFEIKDADFKEILNFNAAFDMKILKEKCDNFLLSRINNLEAQYKNLSNNLTEEYKSQYRRSLFEYYNTTTRFALPKSMDRLLSIPTSQFPEDLQKQITSIKQNPPKFESVSQRDMMERILSTRIGTDMEVKVGDETLYIDSTKLKTHPYFKNLLTSDQAVVAIKPQMSTKALKHLIEYVYYGKIEKIDFKEFNELYSASVNDQNLADLKTYLERTHLDKLDSGDICKMIGDLHVKEDAEVIKILLQRIGVIIDSSLELEDDVVHLTLRRRITQQQIQLIERLNNAIKINKITFAPMEAALSINVVHEILKKNTGVEFLDLDYSSYPQIQWDDHLAKVLQGAPNIKNLHITLQDPHTFVGRPANVVPVKVHNLESLSFSGGYHTEYNDLFDETDLENLKELKIPDFNETKLVALVDYLDRAPNLEKLEVKAHPTIMSIIFSKEHPIKSLTVVGAHPKKIFQEDVTKYVEKNKELRTLNIDETWVISKVKELGGLQAFGNRRRILDERKAEDKLNAQE